MSYKNAANSYKKKVDAMLNLTREVAQADEATIYDYADLYPEWSGDGVAYGGNLSIAAYGGNLYRCIQPHTSQPGWTPEAAPSLWARIGDPAEEWPEWLQPTGGHDAYNTGDKVTYGGKHYTSLINSNIWSPEAYPAGWREE